MKDRNEKFKKMVLDNAQDSLDQYLVINEYFEALKAKQVVCSYTYGFTNELESFSVDVKDMTENEYNNLYNLIKYLEKENIIEIIDFNKDHHKLGNTWLGGIIQSKIKFIKH